MIKHWVIVKECPPPEKTIAWNKKSADTFLLFTCLKLAAVQIWRQTNKFLTAYSLSKCTENNRLITHWLITSYLNGTTCCLRVACVAWRFLSGETVITNPKVARSLGERQLRNRLQGWPAFFVSPVRWRTGHFHWIRRRTRQSQFPKGHLHGTAMITMKIFGTQVGNCSRIFFANITKLLTAKHEQDTAVNSFAGGRDAMTVFPTGVRKSMIFTMFYFLRSPGKNCRLRIEKHRWTS